MDPCELDPNFEPQTRARSNTWPLRPNREVLEAQSSPVSEDSSSEAYKEKDPLGLNTKKSGSRRNAWGNLSYADLITKAIQSSPEKRLTLSQIYDWMVQNVPYFKDKGDSTSSAGWKNSIRHNLSLHSRFMRIQNEGTGKSSWWVINPDARPGKTPRRRAGSMETKSYEKKRGRVKKKVEALRAAMENGGSPNASNDDFLDPTFGSLQFGSSEFRPRASSNASSCGRLSPIQAAAEPDLHDNQVPPMSPIPWVAEEGSGSFYGGSQDGFTDQLVDTLVDRMHLGEPTSLGITGSIVATNMQEQYMGEPNSDLDMSEFTSNSTFNQSSSYDNQYQNLPAPPPYPDLQCNSPQPAAQQPRQQQQQPAQQQQQQQGPVLTNLERVPMGRAGFANMNLKQNGMSVYRQQDLFRECQLSINTQVGSPARSPQPSPQTYVPRLSPCPSSTTAHQNGTASPAHVSVSPCHRQLSPVPGQPSPAQPSSPSNQAHARSLLQQRQQLQQEQQQQLRQQLQQQQQQQQGQQIPQVSILRNALTGSYQSNASSQQYPAHLLNHFNAQLNSGHLPAGKPFCSTTDNGLGGGGGGGGNMVRMDPPNTSGDSMEQTQDVYMNGESTPTGNCNTSVPIDIDVDNLMRGLEYDMDQVIKQELSLEGNLDFNFESVGSGVSAAPNQNVVR